MNELTIGSGDEASLSMGTLMGNMEGGGHLPGTLRGFRGPFGEPVESLTEYFWRSPEREHLSLCELC